MIGYVTSTGSRKAIIYLKQEFIMLTYQIIQNRGSDLRQAIERNFSAIAAAKGQEFIFRGDSRKYDFNDVIGTDTILKNLQKGSRILDIGAGKGIFVDHACEMGMDAEGISAGDIQSVTDKVTTKNAELLDQYYPENSFDVIVSAVTFVHFVDPAGALILAYRALKPGGSLYIDLVKLYGLEEYYGIIVEYLKNHYQITADYTQDGIEGLIITKTKAELELPIAYSDNYRYCPSNELRIFIEHKEDAEIGGYSVGDYGDGDSSSNSTLPIYIQPLWQNNNDHYRALRDKAGKDEFSPLLSERHNTTCCKII